MSRKSAFMIMLVLQLNELLCQRTCLLWLMNQLTQFQDQSMF